MRAWDLNLTLDSTGGLPIFLRIARAISNEIRRHRLRPGDPLPGSRTLAKAMQVHRNTILAAYTELVQEGWIETKQAGGTFVSRTLPDARPRGVARMTASRAQAPAPAGFDLRPGVDNGGAPAVGLSVVQRAVADCAPYPHGTLNLANGIPDPRLI